MKVCIRADMGTALQQPVSSIISCNNCQRSRRGPNGRRQHNPSLFNNGHGPRSDQNPPQYDASQSPHRFRAVWCIAIAATGALLSTVSAWRSVAVPDELPRRHRSADGGVPAHQYGGRRPQLRPHFRPAVEEDWWSPAPPCHASERATTHGPSV